MDAVYIDENLTKLDIAIKISPRFLPRRNALIHTMHIVSINKSVLLSQIWMDGYNFVF